MMHKVGKQDSIVELCKMILFQISNKFPAYVCEADCNYQTCVRLLQIPCQCALAVFDWSWFSPSNTLPNIVPVRSSTIFAEVQVVHSLKFHSPVQFRIRNVYSRLAWWVKIPRDLARAILCHCACFCWFCHGTEHRLCDFHMETYGNHVAMSSSPMSMTATHTTTHSATPTATHTWSTRHMVVSSSPISVTATHTATHTTTHTRIHT